MFYDRVFKHRNNNVDICIHSHNIYDIRLLRSAELLIELFECRIRKIY